MDLPVDLDPISAVLRAHGVAFALVFGSHATGSARADSDVDLAVWPGTEYDDWRLRGELPEILDLLDLRTAPEGLAGRVAMTGQVVLDDGYAEMDDARVVAHLANLPALRRFVAAMSALL